MPRIAGVATGVPPYRVDQETAREFVRGMFGGGSSGESGRSDNESSHGSGSVDIERLMPVFVNAGIDTRYFAKPIEWFRTPRTLGEKNAAYIEAATSLGAEVSSAVMARTGTERSQIDCIIYINTTGLATPSIDARLVNVLGLPTGIRRMPIWGLGCAGGAAGIAHATNYLKGNPKGRVLLVAVELCGLTFMADDRSRSNLVATALFADGGAAVLMIGDEVEGEGIEVVDTQSRFYPDSLDVMGWNVQSTGLQVVFAQRIPEIVREHAREDLGGFLGQHGLGIEEVTGWVLHPGGRKVVEAYECALGVGDAETRWSREVLREYGNMSSVTVLFVLERYLREGRGKVGAAVLSALGPGFCSESVLLRG